MTWHPTTNRIQTQLLTPEERSALEAWPHGWECFTVYAKWESREDPSWSEDTVYRGKPAPVVTSKWFNVSPRDTVGPYETRELADICSSFDRIDVLRVDTCGGVSTAHLEGLKDE